jgi:hypothetical protein
MRKIILISLVIAMFFGGLYAVIIKPKIASDRIISICENTRIGQTKEEVLKTLIPHGVTVKVFPPKTFDSSEDFETIEFIDGLLFERYFCILHLRNGQVFEKKISHLG